LFGGKEALRLEAEIGSVAVLQLPAVPRVDHAVLEYLAIHLINAVCSCWPANSSSRCLVLRYSKLGGRRIENSGSITAELIFGSGTLEASTVGLCDSAAGGPR
jgi:hypothetical protein